MEGGVKLTQYLDQFMNEERSREIKKERERMYIYIYRCYVGTNSRYLDV